MAAGAEESSTLVELEHEFARSPAVTVRQAVDILRQEGLLHCHQGRGTFVAESRRAGIGSSSPPTGRS